jgi:tRNA U34 2-thiouridine synthase MnmA/TrmU
MSTPLRRKIAVALSGGVDSSVAAFLLKQNPDNELVALHMSNWNPQDEEDAPPGCLEQDIKDSEAVCQHLSLPLHKASFAAEYWTGVFEPFVDGIASGSRPNPDVGCNSIVKFGAMKKYAHERLGVDWIATGHYARLWNRSLEPTPDMEQAIEQHDWLYNWGANDNPLLLAGVDKTKDQSYFLAGVQGFNFRNVIFPLGDLMKTGHDTTVRSIAEEAQLPNASKRESMGICFVGKRDFGSFISQYLPSVPPPGNFVDVDTGEVVGQHSGSLHYTAGQGAKISGAQQKWFVVGKDAASTVLVCGGTHHPALYADEMRIDNMVWIGGDLPAPLNETGRLRLQCRVRHLQPLIPCEMQVIDGSSYVIRFDLPVRAIAPGQMAAFYVGDVCLGGGAITDRGASYHERGLDLPTYLHPAGHNDLSVKTA